MQEAANGYYSRWLVSSPIDRLLMRPDRPDRFDSGPFTRVEQRGVALLLKAVPTQIREDIVSMRKLSTIEIIGTILTVYQPGGLKERSALLRYLTPPEAARSISDALKGVRRWSRWRCRADELSIAIPDATLLVAGLDTLTTSIVSQYPEVQFRVQTFRHQNTIDHIPTQDKAVSLGQMLQAELQILGNTGPAKRSKVARLQEGTEGTGDNFGNKTGGKGEGGKAKGLGKKQGKEGKAGEGSGEVKACYHWMGKNGCKLGRECRFAHDKAALASAPDVNNRCFVCNGIGHRAADCPTSQGSSSNASHGSQDGDKNKGGKGSGKPSAKGTPIRRVEEDRPLADEQAKLTSAAASLIEQMQAKAPQERPEVSKLSQEADRTRLLDSGAATCLRRAKGSEPKGLVRKLVDLAQGSVELFVTACGTVLSLQVVETIVALGPMIKLGCRLQWMEAECVLWHPARGRITLDVRSGCLRIPETLALELIEEVENYRRETVGATLKPHKQREESLRPTRSQREKS